MTTGAYRGAARVVVTGLDPNRRSTIVADGPAAARWDTEAWTIQAVWRAEGIPVDVLSGSSVGAVPTIEPPAGGYSVVTTTFPPDAGWDFELRYAQSLAVVGAVEAEPAETRAGEGSAGFHRTDSVDVAVVISGEIHAVLEAAETLLTAGDVFIQRGTRHAWRNRGDVDCVVVFFQVGATRD